MHNPYDTGVFIIVNYTPISVVEVPAPSPSITVTSVVVAVDDDVVPVSSITVSGSGTTIVTSVEILNSQCFKLFLWRNLYSSLYISYLS